MRRGSARALGSVVVAAVIGALTTGAGASSALAAHARPAPAAASQGLDVLPFPGTPDAAPATSVAFPAVAPGQIASISVVGSRSGTHSGRLSAQPGDGSAFTPARPFAPGETVSVTATMRSAVAAAASGAPGARRLRFAFTVARPGTASPPTPSAATEIAGPAAPGRVTHTYLSAPTLHPPIITISGTDTDTSAGNIFLDAQKSGHPGAYFVNPKGDLLWFHPTSTGSEFTTRVQSYQGKPVLTYWQGSIPGGLGLGHGKGEILNEHYQTIHTITAGNGLQKQGIDFHEFALGTQGKTGVAFVQIWKPVPYNLTSVGGPANGTVYDWIIQEIDIATNHVMWEWHALGHVPINRTYQHYVSGQTFDYFHLNSIQPLSDGHVIISARNTWAIYSIDMKTGKINWQLGGKHASFKRGPGANFEWQHDATLHANGLVTVFDDAAPPPEEKASRALEIHISTSSHKATLVHGYTHSPKTLAYSMGSVEIVPNRNVFVGWGASRYFSEYQPGGAFVFGGEFPQGVQSYRAYRFNNWVGSPLQPPGIAVRAAPSGHAFVYVSWNGSTLVHKWEVLGSKTRTGPFTKLALHGWSSFETKIETASMSYFKVEALDSHGHVLPHGTSGLVSGP